MTLFNNDKGKINILDDEIKYNFSPVHSEGFPFLSSKDNITQIFEDKEMTEFIQSTFEKKMVQISMDENSNDYNIYNKNPTNHNINDNIKRLVEQTKIHKKKVFNIISSPIKSSNILPLISSPSSVELKTKNNSDKELKFLNRKIKFYTNISESNKEKEAKKIRKKLGGRKKNSVSSKADKLFRSDNIQIQIKCDFIKSIFYFLQVSYNQNQKNKKFLKTKRKLKKIDLDPFKKIGNSETKERFLEMTIRDLFSGEISKSYKNIEDKYINKAEFEIIFRRKKEKKLMIILNKKVKDLAEIYLGINKNQSEEDSIFYKDFKKLNDVIKELKNKGTSEKKINLYKENALHMMFGKKK